jgi:hypothetical protein
MTPLLTKERARWETVVMVDHADRSLLAWIYDRAPDAASTTGFDVLGWDASAWILHRMYEHTGVSDETTWDERRKRELATGRVEPEIVGTVNLDETTTLTGVPIGGRAEPAPDWQRLAWTELAQRLGLSFDGARHPPSFRWFPYKSWPIRISPAVEGSMERADLRDLVDVLSHHSSAGLGTKCVCFFAPLASRRSPMNWDELDLRETTLRGLLDVYDESEQSPSNFWPDDQSWFVYTDWDLEGTKVSGTAELIAALVEDARLETIIGPW